MRVRPQAPWPPALTRLKLPAGGGCGCAPCSADDRAVLPQRTGNPYPTLTWVYVPAGKGEGLKASPQHTVLSPGSRPQPVGLWLGDDDLNSTVGIAPVSGGIASGSGVGVGFVGTPNCPIGEYLDLLASLSQHLPVGGYPLSRGSPGYQF